MPVTLDSFITDIKELTIQFEAAWRKKAQEDPVNYPLAIDEDNSGIWTEMFLGFIETGKV